MTIELHLQLVDKTDKPKLSKLGYLFCFLKKNKFRDIFLH